MGTYQSNLFLNAEKIELNGDSTFIYYPKQLDTGPKISAYTMGKWEVKGNSIILNSNIKPNSIYSKLNDRLLKLHVDTTVECIYGTSCFYYRYFDNYTLKVKGKRLYPNREVGDSILTKRGNRNNYYRLVHQ